MQYKTLKEAQKIAEMENMGRDYGTAIVVMERTVAGSFYKVVII